jgi:predicted SAM-dependent methyltransferase
MKNDQIQDIKSKIVDLLASGKYTHGLKRASRNLLKEIDLFENYLEGKRQLKNNNKQFDFTKVQVGGGVHTLKGFINIDIVPPADIIWDVREGLPIPDKVVKFVFSEHFFEHIDYPISAKRVISEFGRIIKDGGCVILGVPDTKLVINSYHDRDKKFYKKAMSIWYSKRNILNDFNTYIDLLNFHMRDQDDSSKYSPHMWSYDFEKLQSLFLNVGFSNVKPWKFDSVIANPGRKWGSLYVIATK